MKRLITIILALIMTLINTPNQGADQPHVTAEKTPQTAITVQVEQVPEESETTAETAFVGEVSETETTVETDEITVTESETEFTEEKTSTEQETVTEEYTEITEETVIAETKEETVECIDEGDQSLAEYKTQIGGQPNPFENNTPTEIDDRPVEDYVGEGEDRPGEGNRF